MVAYKLPGIYLNNAELQDIVLPLFTGKIKEFNQAAGSVQDAEISELESMASGRSPATEKQLATLATLSQWSPGMLHSILKPF